MIKVRKHTNEDLPVLKELVYKLHQEVIPFHQNLAPTDEVIDDYFDYLLNEIKTSSGTFFIAEVDGEAAGYLCLFGLIKPSEPDIVKDKYSYISDLYIDSKFQKKGIGKLLIEEAEKFAKQLGAKRIELGTAAKNYNAINFYKNLDFKESVITFTKKL